MLKQKNLQLRLELDYNSEYNDMDDEEEENKEN